MSDVRSPDWDQACAGALFHTAQWQALLANSFKTRSIYVTSGGSPAAALAVFKAGPFSVGYVGFPTGGLIDGGHANASDLQAWKQGGQVRMPTCLRIPVSAFSDDPELRWPSQSVPETAITDLQRWSLSSASQNVRRSIKKAGRAGFELLAQNIPADADAIFAMYEATIQKHGGAMRYNNAYFRELIALGSARDDLNIFLAKRDGKIAAFLVSATHLGVGYYLHGGTHENCLKDSPGALLMNHAVAHARESGAHCFNFMSSPVNQPSLVNYKEKWGGVTRQHRTFTVPMRASYPAFQVAEKLYKLIR